MSLRSRLKPWRKAKTLVDHIGYSEVTGSTKIKTYNEIPSPKDISSIPPALKLMLNGGPSKFHLYCDRYHKALGPIFRERLGSLELLFLSGTNLIQTVVANEGKYPHHNVPEAWSYYNKVNNVKRGLFFQIGEDWASTRRAFNKIFLGNHQEMDKFSSSLLNINSDLFANWKSTLEKTAEGGLKLTDLRAQLCRWSLETTAYLLFGARLDCIARNSDDLNMSKADDLVTNVAKMFIETSKFQIIPVKLAHRLRLKSWKNFETASNQMLSIANQFVQENINKIKSCRSESSLIANLIDQGSISEDELSRSAVDLMIAAADTTVNVLEWVIYIAARNPSVMRKLQEESDKILSSDHDTDNIRNRAVYLKAFIREIVRLYPTAPFLARTLDRDINLAGYMIPAGKTIVFSLYTTSRMKEYFDDPLEIKPERWIRSESKTYGKPDRSAYASLPFGIGARMCIGRRAADLEMILLLASLVKTFDVKPLQPGEPEIESTLKMVLCPSRPINVALFERAN